MIIDDFSNDGSVERVRKLIQGYENKIKIIELDKNIGAAGARNIAIRRADAELISFLDQDDRYRLDKLEKQAEAISKNDVKLVHGNIVHMNEKGDIIREARGNRIRNNINYKQMSKKELSQNLFDLNSIRLGTVMVDRDAFLNLGGFDKDLFGGEDWKFWVEFATQYKMQHIDDMLYEKRTHPRQVGTTKSIQRSQGKIKALDDLLNEYDFLQDKSDKKRSLLVRQIAKRYILDGFPTKGKEALKNNLDLKKWRLKEISLYFLTHTGKFGASILNIYMGNKN